MVFKESPQETAKRPQEDKRVEAMQLATNAKSIDAIEKALTAVIKQKETKLPMWLTIGFITLIIAMLASLWTVFDGYRNEQSKIHSKEALFPNPSGKNQTTLILHNLNKTIGWNDAFPFDTVFLISHTDELSQL